MIAMQEVFMNLNLRISALTAVLVVLFLCTAVSKVQSADLESNIHHEDTVQALTKLAELGVPLQKDPKGDVRWIEAKDAELTDESIRLLPYLPKLEWLEIGNSVLTQNGMNSLGKCTALKRLYIHDISLGGEELAWISNLKQLEALSLQRTQIDGRFLKHLDTVDSLKVLNLSGNPITDEDMAYIARFKNLEVLALEDTQITGSGIGELKGMVRLNELNIRNCSIQDYDLSHFLSMPNLRIVYAEGCYLSDCAIAGIIARFPVLAIFR
jgi:Leucine-rich repeat (LRR) protein